MILSVKAEATMPGLYIDYIGVRLHDGREVSLNWDESEVSYDPDTKEYSARYRGVYFGEEYANGRIGELCGMQITDIQTYSRDEDREYPKGMGVTISRMEFVDGNETLTIDFPEPGSDGQKKESFGELRNELERGAAETGIKVETVNVDGTDAARLVAEKGTAYVLPYENRSAVELLNRLRETAKRSSDKDALAKKWMKALTTMSNQGILRRIFGE